MFSFLLLAVILYATLERSLLTAEEAHRSHADDEGEANGVSAASTALPRLEADVLATRIGLGVGLVGLAWGWAGFALPAYQWLRHVIDVSRLLAGAVALVLPAALLGSFGWWLGHLIGYNRYEGIAGRAWVGWALLLPRLIALPLQKLARLLSPKTSAGEDVPTAEEQLMALSASPDNFWQMVQDEDGRDVATVNRQIFDNAAELQAIRVRECMTFRTDIIGVEEGDGIEGLRDAFLQSGYSKVPVYRDDLDQVLGYVHSLALFRKPKALEEVLSEMLTVPESMTASQLLVEFSRAKKSIAMVIDEYGGTSGLVTMEDVMEEIFGEIQDELDTEAELEREEEPGIYLLSARLEVDYLNEKYSWDLPVGDYESLGGMVTSINQDLPEVGQVIEAAPFSFEIVETEQTHIRTIRLRVES